MKKQYTDKKTQNETLKEVWVPLSAQLIAFLNVDPKAIRGKKLRKRYKELIAAAGNFSHELGKDNRKMNKKHLKKQKASMQASPAAQEVINRGTAIIMGTATEDIKTGQVITLDPATGKASLKIAE